MNHRGPFQPRPFCDSVKLQDGNFKTLLYEESNLTNSFTSEILIYIRGLARLLGLELLVLPQFSLLICPSFCCCWAPSDALCSSRHTLQFCFHSGAVSSSSARPSETKLTTQVFYFHHPEMHEVPSSGAFLHHPVGVF